MEKNGNFRVLYVEPDSYTDVVIITHTFIEYENFSHIIMPETGSSSNNLYIMPDALRFESSGTGNSLHFNETSINVSMYENFKIEDYLSHKLSSGASPSNIISTQSKVNLSLFPTITFNCIYYAS